MADLREPKFARWDDAAKNFTSVTIGDVPLDMVEPWTWPLYRGAKARPVMLIQGSQKRGRFDFLGYGPHTMDITAPTRGDSVEHYQIDGVYIESIDPISDERIRLKLYDARVVLRETVWPIDINVKMPDGTYKVNTSKADKEPWTYRDVLTELDRQTGIELNIDVASETELDSAAPDNLLWGGTLKADEALDRLLSFTQYDFAVNVFGQFELVDSEAGEPIDPARWSWHHELSTGDSGDATVNGAPKDITVLFDRKIETFSEAVTNSRGAGSLLDYRQVYYFENAYIAAIDMYNIYVSALKASEIVGVGNGGQFVADPRRYSGLPDFDTYFLGDDFRNTPFQIYPYDANNPMEVVAAEYAREVVGVIKRDHRVLFKLDLFSVDDYDIEFGLLNEEGGIVDERVVRTLTGIDPNTKQNIYLDQRESTVFGSYVVLNQQPANALNLVDGTGFVPFAQQRFGAIPLKPVWERQEPSLRVVRLVQDSSQTGAGDKVVCGTLNTTPGVSRIAAGDAKALRQYASVAVTANTTEYREWRDGSLNQGAYPKLWMVLTDRKSNNLGKFHKVTVETNIDGAERSVSYPAITGLSAAIRNEWVANQPEIRWRPTNQKQLEAAAARVCAPIIGAFARSAVGYGTMHGVEFAYEWTSPKRQVQEMGINFWGYGENTILTDATFIGVKFSGAYTEHVRRANNEQKIKRIGRIVAAKVI